MMDARMKSTPLVLVAAGLLAAVSLGCGAQKKTTKAPTASGSVAPTRGGETAREREARSTAQALEDRIYFAYDDANLDAHARRALDLLAQELRQRPEATVMIAGHADERGTNEYNVALGERRAIAARDYLVRLGIEARRIRTVSFGEERPAVPGSTEEAWSKNRRGELEVHAGGQLRARN
jgi:peptidoglycan-associated lipoprotein